VRISLVADHIGPLSRSGEVDAMAAPLARALAARQHRVTLWVRGSEVAAPDGVELAILPGPTEGAGSTRLVSGIPAAASRLAAAWAADPPDVVHALSWTAGLAALAGGRDLDIPVVQTFEELASPDRPDFAARSRLERAVARSAALLVARSAAAAEELSSRVPRTAVARIPCGVDVDLFTPDGPAPPRTATRRIVALCPLAGEYGADMAVRGLRRAPKAELTIVGGPYPADLPTDPAAVRLSEEVVRCRVSGRVHLVGALRDEELPSLLRGADLVLCPATAEPSGAAALAAMACGAPLLATAVDALADIVAEGASGELVEPRRPEEFAAALHDLLGDPTRLAGYRIGAADRAQARYSWPRIAANLESAYQGVVTRSRRAAG
jgi:glycosyltransferase involved in cell wall biosynthesis